MTLKQGQVHPISSDNVDAKEGYNHIKYERCSLNSVRAKVNFKLFFYLRKSVSYFQLICANVKRGWSIPNLLDILNKSNKVSTESFFLHCVPLPQRPPLPQPWKHGLLMHTLPKGGLLLRKRKESWFLFCPDWDAVVCFFPFHGTLVGEDMQRLA